MKSVETRDLTGFPLVKGGNSLDTRRVQELLALAALRGFANCATSIDGDFGPATKQAVVQFQTAPGFALLAGVEPRAITLGEVDKATWGALVAPLKAMLGPWRARSAIEDTVLSIADGWLGWQPTELGASNLGPVVRLCMTRPGDRGLRPGPEGSDWPWCAGSATTIVALAAEAHNVEPPVPYSWSCPEMLLAAEKRGKLVRGQDAAGMLRVRAGSIFLVKGLTPWQPPHTGIVARWHADGTFETYEGNASKSGSYDGGRFMQYVRARTSCDFIVL